MPGFDFSPRNKFPNLAVFDSFVTRSTTFEAIIHL